MDTTLTLSDIEAEIADVTRRYKQELADLEAAKRVFTRRQQQESHDALKNRLVRLVPKEYGAKKRFSLSLLAERAQGLPSHEIVAALAAGGWPTSTAENTTPLLSNYKSDGLLDQKDGRWVITTKGRNYLAAPKS